MEFAAPQLIPALLTYAHKVVPFRVNHAGDYDPFIKRQRAVTELTLWPYVVQVWSRYLQNLEGTIPS
jgi:hypothetical protein